MKKHEIFNTTSIIVASVMTPRKIATPIDSAARIGSKKMANGLQTPKTHAINVVARNTRVLMRNAFIKEIFVFGEKNGFAT